MFSRADLVNYTSNYISIIYTIAKSTITFCPLHSCNIFLAHLYGAVGLYLSADWIIEIYISQSAHTANI